MTDKYTCQPCHHLLQSRKNELTVFSVTLFFPNIFNMLIYHYSLILAKLNIYINYLTSTKITNFQRWLREHLVQIVFSSFLPRHPTCLGHSCLHLWDVGVSSSAHSMSGVQLGVQHGACPHYSSLLLRMHSQASPGVTSRWCRPTILNWCHRAFKAKYWAPSSTANNPRLILISRHLRASCSQVSFPDIKKDVLKT